MQANEDIDPKIAALCITSSLQSLMTAYHEFKQLDDAALDAVIAGDKLTDDHRQNRHCARSMVMHHVWMLSRFVTPEVVKLLEQRAND
jgi:hypothetical protein